MYPSSGATIRGDLNTYVEQAAQSTNFNIGLSIFPPFPVEKKSGAYPYLKLTNGALLTANSTIRANRGSYNEIDRTWDTDTYDTIDRGLVEAVDDAEKEDQSRWFDAELVTAKLLLRAMMLDHETRVAAALFNTTNFGSATNSTAAYTTANKATMDFPTDVLAAIEKVNDNGEVADTIVMSPNVLNRIKTSTLLQNFIRGNRPSDSTTNITAQMVQQAFADNGIKNVFIGRARYNGAKKGQTYSATRVWSDTYVWVGQVSSGDIKEGGAGRTLVWNKEGGVFVTESYRDDNRRANMLRVRQNTAEKVVNGNAGTLIATQYS